MCRQVSRLGFLLLGRLPIPLWGTVAFCPFVRFTVTGIAQKSHLHSHGIAQSNTGAVLRTNTRYSFQNTQAPPVRRYDNTFRLANSPPFEVFRSRSP